MYVIQTLVLTELIHACETKLFFNIERFVCIISSSFEFKKMKIYFLVLTLTFVIPQFRKLTDLALTGLIEPETLPDYFEFEIDDFDGAELLNLEWVIFIPGESSQSRRF